MSFTGKLHLLIIFLFVLFKGTTASAQNRASDTTVIVTDTTDLDLLFKKAREFSYNENYTQSRRICQKILEKNPTYYDVRTFLGRTYAWEKMYDNARTELSRVLIEKENDYEALDALFDVEFWSENYEVAGDYIKIALGYYPNSEGLLIKKATLQLKLEDKSSAALTLRRILDLNPGQKEAQQLMNTLAGRKLNNYFQTGYTVDQYDKERSAQQLVSVEFGRTYNFGSLAMRLNGANRFGNNGLQTEFESYVHFTQWCYADLEIGFANDDLFPRQKYGAEAFFKLPANFEYSAGFRFQQFNTGTTYYTTSLGNYFKDYWFDVRTFFTPGKDTLINPLTRFFKVNSFTLLISARKYFGDGDTFFGVRLGRGQSPDERRINDIATNDVATHLLAYNAAVEFEKTAFGRWLLKADLTYSKEDIREKSFTQRITTVLTIKTVF